MCSALNDRTMTLFETARDSHRRLARPREPGRERLTATFHDIRAGLRMRDLWLFLGWRDVKRHYSRSLIGPLWLTLSMGVMVAGLGVLYSQIFRQDIRSYLPFIAIGFVIWGLIAGLINGACLVFSGAAESIRQIRLPLSVYILKFTYTQILIFAHNFIIYILVAVIFDISPGIRGLLFLPALFLLIMNGIFVAMILGPLCARFRDIPLIVASFIQIAFFMTPILWYPEQVPERAFFLNANPFYHFIEITRGPLLGQTAALENWLACFGMTVLLGVIALAFFSRFRARIAYWV